LQEEDLEGFIALLDDGYRMQNSDEDDDTQVVKEIKWDDLCKT
jgi:hypothetical protein